MSARAMNLLAALCVALALVALGAAALLRLAQLPKFQLKRIDVRGDLRHVTAASVRTATAGRLRGNYFTTRLEDTRRLFETVPWVAHVSVRRTWPDRLLVTLTEHRALGVWDDGRLLSDRGVLFVANPDEAEIYGALPEFSGASAAAKDAARRFYELSAQFATLSLRIDAIEISERNAWSLHLSSEDRNDSTDARVSRVELGRDDAAGADGTATLGQRVTQLVAAYPLVVAQLGAPPARIDARYANGLAATAAAGTVATKGLARARATRP
ncbi:MAG: FtsQ-type POTRA domain-containing protein [Burkholderiaceae bacterium]